MSAIEPTTAARLRAALADGPGALFARLSELFTAISCIRTATFIAVAPDRSVTHRIGTSNPDHFPVGNVDPVGDDVWNNTILGQMPAVGISIAMISP